MHMRAELVGEIGAGSYYNTPHQRQFSLETLFFKFEVHIGEATINPAEK